MLIQAISWCWLIFILFWTANAFTNKRTEKRMSLGSKVAYGLPCVLGSLLIVKSYRASGGTAPFVWLGLMLTVLGLILAIWARISLGRNWSGSVTVKKDHELVETGPYAYMRHPIYTALLLMFLGTALALETFGGFLGFILFFMGFWIKLLQEEHLMRKQFPTEYPSYEKRVKRLIPFIF